MKSQIHLLQLELFLHNYKFALLCFISAFVVTLLAIPPVINLIRKYSLYDMPSERKEHRLPIPTMGGIPIMAGMMTALLIWLPFSNHITQVCFFFSLASLFALGIMDDIKDLSAKYKLIIQVGLASLIALSGIRIHSFDGLFGIHELPLAAQYTFTILAIVGITNSFNLIDGIDGLAGGLGFMSLITLGLVLVISGDGYTALIAFSLAGAMLAFLYFNFNPARIFMGDTGSLILGFVIAVLSIRLMQLNINAPKSLLPNAPIFALGIVLLPVFDTLRVFAVRIWNGKSPFEADRTHIHHLLTNGGFDHSFASRLICVVHGAILMEVSWFRSLRPELTLCILIVFMLFATAMIRKLGASNKLRSRSHFPYRI